MRGRKRIISLVAVLSVILVFSGVFASGVVDVPLRNLISPTQVEPLQTDEIAVYPAYYFKDYLLQQIGSTFWVHVNVSSVTDLFTWQLNITWNKAILNASQFVTGNNATYILYQTTSTNKTASYQLGWVINATKNDKGYAGAAESILDNRTGLRGVSTSGWLRMVSIKFKVVGYGWCDLVISSTGTLATKLLDSVPGHPPIAFTKTDGYFSNKLIGDIDGVGPPYTVDFYDFGLFAQAYLSSGPPAGSPTSTWNREADFNHDGYVDFYDFGFFAQNYLRSV